jgi:uncharacterized protein (DUF58 family)
VNIEKEINEIKGFKNLELLANQVVEGFISGLHKSPFHGFSAEFAEHKIYNNGESTKHIDWKLFCQNGQALHQALRRGNQPALPLDR